MDEAGRAYAEGLGRCLEGLEDPRVVPRCAYRLFDIVAITLLAVMCGSEDWPDIEQFGSNRSRVGVGNWGLLIWRNQRYLRHVAGDHRGSDRSSAA